MSLVDYRTLLEPIIQDTAEKLAVEVKDAAILAAAAIYARHRPRVRVTTLTGNGTAFDFAVPSDWEDGVSTVRSIEYPVGQQRPSYLDEGSYTVRRSPTTPYPEQIRLLSLVLATGETAYLRYTVSHVVSAVQDTVPVADRLAVVKLAGSECARMLAAYYAQTSDATLGADTVNYRTKSQEYLALAKALETAYREHVGVGTGVSAASVSGDFDVDLQGDAGPPFFHSPLDR